MEVPKIDRTFSPNRVLINAEGDATTSRRAREIYGIVPDIMFLRNDGWVLGAPKEWETVASSMWWDEWTHFVRRPNMEWQEIGEYGE